MTSPATGDFEIITLQETGNDTGVFRNTTGLPTSFQSVVPGNGVIEALAGSKLRVTYFDDDFPYDNTRDTAVVHGVEE